ncbi:MAG: hypothetical protein GY696_11705 [Gammaproteobacteria bacterium]|nr:hypothetical protein [Gammaproteobacteria bacterium]
MEFNPMAAPFFPQESGKVFTRQTVTGRNIEVRGRLKLEELRKGLEGHPDPEFIKFILRTVKEGADIGVNEVTGGRQPRACRNSLSVTKNQQSLWQEIQKDVLDGYKVGPFQKPPFPGFICSPIAAVPKKEPGKVRIIHNLSAPAGASVNDKIGPDYSSTGYETFDRAVDMIRKFGKNAWMGKMDLKSAFKHVVVRPDQWHLLGMHLDDSNNGRQYYFDATIPMGSSSSPAIFNKFTEAIKYSAKKAGVSDIYGYVDDFMVVAPTREECLRDMDILKKDGERMGWLWADDKERGPSQIMELLGIEIDARLQQLKISKDRLQEILALTSDFLRKTHATGREIASIHGKLQFVAKVCRPGRAFLRRVIELSKKTREKLDESIRLDEGMKEDLKWWNDFLPEWNGISMIPDVEWVSNADVALFTDACNHGIGAFLDGEWIYGELHDWFYRQSMPFKEFLAIVAATATFGHLWRGKKIRFHTDSETVVFKCIELRRARAPAMAALFRLLYKYCAKFDCLIGAVHVPGIENSEADAISRAEIGRFFSLVPQASPLPTPIPGTFVCEFFSELRGSEAGRIGPTPDRSILDIRDSQNLQNSNETVPPNDGRSEHSTTDLALRSQGLSSDIHCPTPLREDGALNSEHMHEWSSTSFPVDTAGTRKSETGDISVTRKHENNENTTQTEDSYYDGFAGKASRGGRATAQRERNLGGDGGWSIRTSPAGRTGSCPPDRVLPAETSNTGRLGFPIEFGFFAAEDDEDGSSGKVAPPDSSALCLSKESVPRLFGQKYPTNPGDNQDGTLLHAGRNAALQGYGDSETQRMDVDSGLRCNTSFGSFIATRRGDVRADGGLVGSGTDEVGALEVKCLSSVPSPTREVITGDKSQTRPGRINYRRLNGSCESVNQGQRQRNFGR